MLLLKNGISKLHFSEALHNLESFNKVLNWENKQNTLELSFDNEIPFLTDDFKVNLLYEKNKINKISISNNINTLIQCNYDNDDDNFTSGQSLNELGIELDGYISGRAPFDSFILNVNITFLIDLIYSKQLKQKFYEIKENNKVDKKTIVLNNLIVGSQEIFNTTFQDLIDLHHKEIELDSCRTCALNNEINALEKNHLLYLQLPLYSIL